MTTTTIAEQSEIEVLLTQIAESGRYAYEPKRKTEPYTVRIYTPLWHYWQGDMGIVIIPELPKGVTKIENMNPRLVPGEITRGNSHVLSVESMENVKAYALANPNALQGPILVTTGPILITHPQHQDYYFAKPVILAIIYQRSGNFATEIERQMD